MYNFDRIFYFMALLVTIYATKKAPPLQQLEGPWMIRNASENALSVIGNCPSMKIQSNPTDSSGDGVILLKTTVQTFTLTMVNVDRKLYQLFIPSDNKISLIGNVSVLESDKHFLITELQTEDQVYFGVLTKDNQTTPSTHKQIESKLKSSTPTKNVSFAPVQYENCTNQEKNSESHATTMAEGKDSIQKLKELGNRTNKPVSDITEPEERSGKPSEDKSTTGTSARSSDQTETLPLSGNNTKVTDMPRGSGTTATYSDFLTMTSISLLFVIKNVQ